MTVQEIISELNAWAPPSYQESYDNASLITGQNHTIVKGILITLDCTEAIVGEAIEKGCNMIVAHHPIIFQGLKTLTGKSYVERTVIKAIKNDIAIYTIHTNLDNIYTGVNKKICDTIGLDRCKILSPKKNTLCKLVTFAPYEHADDVIESIFNAGAGQVGNYDQCSYQIEGIGTFRPNDKANPYLGQKGQTQKEKEKRIEIILPKHLQSNILKALKSTHPYEEVAYYFTDLTNENQEVGSGMIGQLPNEMNPTEFLQLLKTKFQLSVIKHTKVHKDKIKNIAVCGGSGSFLLKKAIAREADVFVSSDFKYHEYFDTNDQILIADIGHYESEVFTKELIYEFLNEKIANIAVNLSERGTNPIKYFK